MLMYVGLIALPLIAAFFSYTLFNTRKTGDAVGWYFGTLIGSIVVFVAIVPAIATGMTGPDHLRRTMPIDGKVTTNLDDGDGVVKFTSNGKKISLVTNDDDMEQGTVAILDSKGDIPHWDFVCDETPDWASPFTMSECHNYLYVPVN